MAWEPGQEKCLGQRKLASGKNGQTGEGKRSTSSVTPATARACGDGPAKDASGAFVEPVYNIEVEGDHCYRVGEQGLLVHNASAKECGLFEDRFGSEPEYTMEPADNTGKQRTKLMRARLNKDRVKGGQEPTVDPEGYPSTVNQPNQPVKVARGHILAKELGGKADAANRRNLIPICQQTTNISMRDYAENKVAEIIEEGYTVDYEVKSTYWSKDPWIPMTITIRAKGWKCGVDDCWKIKTVVLDQIFDLSKCPTTRN